jgi:hypothetical protein
VPQPFTCNNNYNDGDPAGTYTLEIVDTATKVETDVHGVVNVANCPGADGMLVAFVLDAAGGIVLETGPFAQLTPIQLPVGLLGVISWAYGTTGQGPATSVTALAAPVSAPDQEEIDAIDLATFGVTVVVPPVPASVAWATGATPAGSLESTSVAGSSILVQPLDGHYIYPRAMGDGGATMFAGPFASGAASELALFELPPGAPLPFPSTLGLGPGSIRPPNKALLIWQFDAGASASDMIVWNDSDLVVTTCPSVGGVYLEGWWSPDQSKVLFVVPQGSYQYGGGGPIDLFTLGGSGGTDSCHQVTSDNAVAAGFSPDGAFIFWVAQPPTGGAQLWSAASDGSGARMIGTGEINSPHFLGDGGARLEMILAGELDWLDLHDVAGTLHHVAEQVHGSIYDITGGHWLIMGYQWSETDGTGTLALINRDDGEVRPISRSVAQYEVLPEELGVDGGVVDPFGDAGVSHEFVVAYVVRGRNPSTQDGIWRATITPADLQ